MTYKGVRDAFILAIGDVGVFYLSLWLTLTLRYGRIPDASIWDLHLIPFSFLFIAWLVSFYIAGLYERPVLALRVNATALLFKVHALNSVAALIFFYFIPFLGITPKVNLVLFLFVSLLALHGWRALSYWILRSREPTSALLIASGDEMKELREEVNADARRRLAFISSIDLERINGIDPQKDVVRVVYSEEVKLIAIDLRHEYVEKILPHLYNLIFSNIRFVDMQRLYEEVFNRVPLSVLRYNWFLENISDSPRSWYETLKRLVDVFVGGAVGALSLVVYPFVVAAIYIEDGGPLFFSQERIGKNNAIITIHKFRTMTTDGARVTRVGRILRSFHIDELPQLWGVVGGSLSLIGPRPEIPDMVHQYEKVLSYYNIRHLVKPGLSGWAQLYHDDPPKFRFSPHHTALKLSYDLYYIKNRSFFLDLKVALKTIKHILMNKGK